MSKEHMCRRALAGIVAVGFVVLQAPSLAWAQLETVDPALHAAVEALVAHDPEIMNDPELAELCRTVAEATVLDPAERAAVTSEVVALHREGIDLNTVIPTEVRDAAREQFTQVQGQMREQLETLRATDPQRAQEVEFMMQEGERCMLAFETGEQYTPSPEMVAHAEGMMREWETDMIANGASPEFIERAHQEFAAWSSGEMTEVMGMMGPGHEMGGPGGMPTPEQMQAMVDGGQMTPEQFQMATEYMQGGFEGNFEAYHGMETEYMGMSPTETFNEWAATEGQTLDAATVEHMREMVENNNIDTTAAKAYEDSNPPPGPHTLVQDNPPGQNDGWDGGDADNLVDHFHTDGTASH